MISDMKNPATRAAGRAPKYDCLAADRDLEITEKARSLQDFRASFIARKFRISRDIAQIVAPLAFGMEVAP